MKTTALIVISIYSFLFYQMAMAIQPDDVIAKDHQAIEIKLIIDRPTVKKDLSLEYDLDGIRLNPEESVYIKIPDEYRNRKLDFVSMSHRQSPRDERECGGYSDKDCLPGYSSLEVYNEFSSSEGWRCWGGTGSGPCNSKFAEIRDSTPETDNLYEWRKKGHINTRGRGLSYDPIIPTLFRVRSVGPDSVRVHKIIIKFLPPQPDVIADYIFSNGFQFGDYETASGRKYPGNASYGDYGHPLHLERHSRPDHPALKGEINSETGYIEIPILRGKKLLFVDIAAGDMKRVPRGADPENYRGGAVLSIDLVNRNNEIDQLMNSENVGTNGVLRGSPSRINLVIQDGQFLKIYAPKGTAHIMGIRIGYGD